MKIKLSFLWILTVNLCQATNTDFLSKQLTDFTKLCTTLQSNFTKQAYNAAEEQLQTIINFVDPLEKRISELKKRVAVAEQVHLKNAQSKNTPAPLLSFIMPAYNRSTAIKESLDAIYNQNLSFPFEVIVVDDCSKDGTYAILQEYEQKYSNFFAYRHEKNQRAPTTRNTAIAYARGKYICNVDSDDVLKPNTIEKILTRMIASECDVCFFDILDFFKDHNYTKTEPTYKATTVLKAAEGDLHDIFTHNIIQISAGNRIFTKKSWLNVGGYIEMRGHDSWAFSFLLLAKGYRAYFCPDSSYWHRLWSSKTNMWDQDQRDKVDDISPLEAVQENIELFNNNIEKFISSYPKNTFIKSFIPQASQLLRNKKELQILFKAYRFEEEGDFENAAKYYILALEQGITHKRIYLKLMRTLLHLQNFDNVRNFLEKIIQHN